MASALMILFLGCWLAGQSGVSGEGTDSAGIQESNPSMTEKEEDRTGRAPPGAHHSMHALGALVPGAAAVPADARFHPTEGNYSPETEEPDSTTMEPEGKEGTESAETQQTDPHPMGSEGKDAGSSPAPGTNLTQPGVTPTPAHPGGAGPGTESGGRTSTSTSPETEGTDPAGPQQTVPPPPPMEPEGEEGTGPAGFSGPLAGCSDSSPMEPEGEGESESRPAPGSTHIIAGVSAVAAGLFLLLLAFLCYRRKGPAPRQSRESEPATTVYALMGEGTQLDVLPQKPDPGAEGHTYAELDGQALQAKQGGAAPAPEPPLYSTITMSQGPNGQSPQGAAEPPTDPDSVNPGGVTGETGQEASATRG